MALSSFSFSTVEYTILDGLCGMIGIGMILASTANTTNKTQEEVSQETWRKPLLFVGLFLFFFALWIWMRYLKSKIG